MADWLSYQITPRAESFRRDHGRAVDLEGMQRLMRSNTYRSADQVTSSQNRYLRVSVLECRVTFHVVQCFELTAGKVSCPQLSGHDPMAAVCARGDLADTGPLLKVCLLPRSLMHWENA